VRPRTAFGNIELSGLGPEVIDFGGSHALPQKRRGDASHSKAFAKQGEHLIQVR